MSPLLWFGVFIIALIVLLVSSDYFIDAAKKIGIAWGISPFVVGVTIVAAGTSLPELMTSLIAVINDNSGIVVGNVVGSNLTNIVLVLGVTAFVAKAIHIKKDIFSNDMPFLMASAFMLWFFLRDGVFNFSEGIFMLLGMAAFLLYTFASDEDGEDNEREKVSLITYGILLLSAVGIYFGADYSVKAVEEISISMGIPTDLIAVTLIAFGTSVPELVVSITAVIKQGDTEMAVGNVLGSNIFNTFLVMGLPRMVGDISVSQDLLNYSLPLMLIATFLFLIVSLNRKITRWEGVMLILFYIIFIVDSVNKVYS